MYANPYLNNQTITPSYVVQPTFTQPQASTKILRVNGENGANALQIPPGSEALALDNTDAILWVVQTDDAGYKTVTPWDISPHKKEAEPGVKAIEEKIDALDARMRKLEEALT